MTKNPFINAITAFIYIGIIASIARLTQGIDNSPFAPLAFLSLFTLSAAVMGYIFLSQPLQLFLDGHKKEGANVFLKTIGVFAFITAVTLVVLMQFKKEESVACTMDAKMCSDGSYVGRVPPSCEFAKCSGE